MEVTMQEPDLENMSVELKSVRRKNGRLELKLIATANGNGPESASVLNDDMAKYVMARYVVSALTKSLGLRNAA